jgi:hypothetical protein
MLKYIFLIIFLYDFASAFKCSNVPWEAGARGDDNNLEYSYVKASQYSTLGNNLVCKIERGNGDYFTLGSNDVVVYSKYNSNLPQAYFKDSYTPAYYVIDKSGVVSSSDAYSTKDGLVTNDKSNSVTIDYDNGIFIYTPIPIDNGNGTSTITETSKDGTIIKTTTNNDNNSIAYTDKTFTDGKTEKTLTNDTGTITETYDPSTGMKHTVGTLNDDSVWDEYNTDDGLATLDFKNSDGSKILTGNVSNIDGKLHTSLTSYTSTENNVEYEYDNITNSDGTSTLAITTNTGLVSQTNYNSDGTVATQNITNNSPAPGAIKSIQTSFSSDGIKTTKTINENGTYSIETIATDGTKKKKILQVIM